MNILAQIVESKKLEIKALHEQYNLHELMTSEVLKTSEVYGLGFHKAGYFDKIIDIQNPTFVRKAKLQLIAVKNRFWSAQNGQKLPDFNFPYAAQRIVHHLLFVVKLRCIVQVLPFAAAADRKVLTKSLHPVRRRGYNGLYLAFRKAALLFLYIHIYHVAGYCAIHKNRHTFRCSSHAFTPIGDAVNVDIRKGVMFSCHDF